MTPRVARLRRESLDARPSISTERAELVTEAMMLAGLAPVPLRRAMVFRHLLAHKAVHIGDGELIVGERGPAPKATPTYPSSAATRSTTSTSCTRARRSPLRLDRGARRCTRADHPVLAGRRCAS
jgi:hypothetical protein